MSVFNCSLCAWLTCCRLCAWLTWYVIVLALCAVQASGTSPVAAPEDWRVALRYSVTIPPLPAGEEGDAAPAARVWALLTLSQPGFERYVRFYTVNNDTGDVAAHALLTTGEQPLAPNATGFSLLATLRAGETPLPSMVRTLACPLPSLCTMAGCPSPGPLWALEDTNVV